MNPKRFATTIAGAVLTPAVLLAASAGPALADTGVTTAPTSAASPAAATDIRTQTIARYGVYPLPVPVRAITRFRLSKRTLRDIAAAHRLANTREGRKIRVRESGNDYRYADGRYFGAWNFDRGTWLSNGGGRFGATANRAPAWAQDYIMWRTHKARGWSPWSTA